MKKRQPVNGHFSPDIDADGLHPFLMAEDTIRGAILNGSYPAAAVFIQLHHLLDGVDGNLARTYDRCTDFGRRLDIYSDQAVNLALFASLAYVAEVPPWLAVSMLATLYIDLLLVRLFIGPFSQHHTLIRDRWKQWFMDRGLMPAFDIFTIYLFTSVCLLFETPETAVVLITISKTLDWLYRLYECARTWMRTGQTDLEG